MEALEKMSIEETYKGMWSSDPELLKSLLDGGNTILGRGLGGKLYSLESTNGVAYWIGDENYSWAEFFEDWIIGYGVSFLIPPRPLVLDPKPLVWKHSETGNTAGAVDGDWTFYAMNDGYWGIHYNGIVLSGSYGKSSDIDTAKEAIHAWRVNHLKSMLP